MEVRTAVDNLLSSDPLLVKEERRWIQGCNNMASNHPPPPARITLSQIMEKQVELYCRVPPPGGNIPI